MTKWADFLISEVRYTPDHKRVLQVKQHKDLNGEVSEGEIVDRSAITSNIKKGSTYTTIYNGSSTTWKKGDIVRAYHVDGDYYIRIDKNKVNRDNLGLLAEF